MQVVRDQLGTASKFDRTSFLDNLISFFHSKHKIESLIILFEPSPLAPTGVLRAAINLSNFLLVTSKDDAGEPDGVSPRMAKLLASKLNVPIKLITYPGPGPLSDDVANWDIGNIANEKERAKGGNRSIILQLRVTICLMVAGISPTHLNSSEPLKQF